MIKYTDFKQLQDEIIKLNEDKADLLSVLKELLHVHSDSTYGDLVWRLAVKELAEKTIKKYEQ